MIEQVDNSKTLVYLDDQDTVINLAYTETEFTEEQLTEMASVIDGVAKILYPKTYVYPIKIGAEWNGSYFLNPKPTEFFKIYNVELVDDDWVLDEETHQWVRSAPYPTDGKDYIWNIGTHSWEEVQE